MIHGAVLGAAGACGDRLTGGSGEGQVRLLTLSHTHVNPLADAPRSAIISPDNSKNDSGNFRFSGGRHCGTSEFNDRAIARDVAVGICRQK
jgi:hypothetical protein